MKIFFTGIALFVFAHAYSQNVDSLHVEEWVKITDSMFGKIRGKILPEFVAVDLNGKVFTNADLKDAKATFVNVWFIACPPCIAEIPNLNRLYAMMKDSTDFQFFAITMEPESKLKEAILKYGIHFPVLLASHKTTDQLVFRRGYPINLIVDQDGKISSGVSGGSLKSGPELETYFIKEIEKLRHQKK